MNKIYLTLAACLALMPAAYGEPLYTETGKEPSFAEVMESGKLTRGENSKAGVTGQAVQVKNQLVEVTPESKRPIPKGIKIHTLGNSVIPRGDFAKWTRWYQEHGNTQVFRLFTGRCIDT